ncbi:hypothetical protein [Metabacillus fastidiosus]|uniref:hypothetical protein n=1 Tax=Metabacillus fastidiosus TaxID=1458 RepID=UPI003D28E012
MEKHLSKIVFLIILTIGISLFILFRLEKESVNSFEEIETVELPPLKPLESEILIKTNENVEEQEVISIDKMNDYDSGKLFLTGKEEIKIIQDAINDAIKQPGVVNMGEPQYRIKCEEEAYFLWINEKSGTIQKEGDTHTIYSFSDQSIKPINELMRSVFNK